MSFERRRMFLKKRDDRFFLYNDGYECKDVTNGWSYTGWSAVNSEGSIPSSSGTKNTTNMVCTGTGSIFVSNMQLLGTQQSLNIANYNILGIEVTAVNGSGMIELSVGKTMITYPNHTGNEFMQSLSTTGIIELDLSTRQHRTNNVYISISAGRGNSITVSKIWLK